MAIEVLFVCTANICRSPVAEGLARARSRVPEEFVHFASAGTQAREGRPADPPSVDACRELGADISGYTANLLTSRQLAHTDLVLTATLDHRDHTLRMVPAGLSRSFALKEFVRLSRAVEPAVGPDDVERVIRDVVAQRGLVAPSKNDDIADPYGGKPSESVRAAIEVSMAIDAVLTMLGIRAQ